jgi:PDZ domain-containing protein
VTKRRITWLLWGAAAVLAVVAAFAWFAPGRDYLYLPNTATPVAGKVTVQGGKDDANHPGGIYYVDVTIRRAPSTPHGALVEAVATDAPAAGVLHSGDVIVAARGRQTLTPDQLRRVFVGVKPGSAVTSVRRDGKLQTVSVRTVESPVDPKRAIIGIRVAQAATIKLPRKVKIDLGSVGGPSAGLPFALDVYQELGADVDRGHRVVATGEIGLDGSVGPIGGVKQKTFGARRAHAEVFLVPAGENAAEARRYAGNLRIVPVSSFQQALSVLRTLPNE